MRPAGAELADRREVLPGRWLHAYHAPGIATGARAGQYVHVRPDDWSGLVMRVPFPILTTDPASGNLAILVAEPRGRRIPSWGAGLRPGDRIEMTGPFGRPFEVDTRSRHLLLVASGSGVAGVRLLAEEAIRDGRSVVLLFGAPSAADVYPSSLLPDEVEYVVATEDGSLGHRGAVTDLVRDYEAWADQSFACGPPELLAALTTLATGRRERMGVATLGRKRGAGRPIVPGSPEARRKAFLQVAVEQGMGCAAGTCLGCVIAGTGGPVRACREGPVFAATELTWEAAG